MRIRWVGTSLDDLHAIRTYIAQHNPYAAESIAALIKHSVSNLSLFPLMGRPTDWSDKRVLFVPGSAYMIPYRVWRDEIQVLAVIDTRTERAGSWR